MANPQTENGFLKIANELFEALMKTHFSSEETKVLRAIMRKTFGFHKIWDKISLSQITKVTGLLKQNVHDTIIRLEKRNIIVRESLGPYRGYKLKVQKNYDKWIDLRKSTLIRVQYSKQSTVLQTELGEYSIQSTKVSSIQSTTKDNKETIQKKPSNRKNDSRLEYSEEAKRLAHLFLKMSGVNLRENKKEHTIKTWTDSIVKLHRIDGEEYSKIEEIIMWVTSDQFWRATCLSPVKFRRDDKDGTRYFDVFAFNMEPPIPEEPIRPYEVMS